MHVRHADCLPCKPLLDYLAVQVEHEIPLTYQAFRDMHQAIFEKDICTCKFPWLNNGSFRAGIFRPFHDLVRNFTRIIIYNKLV